MNNQVALQEHKDGNTLKFEIQTEIENESRQRLLGHMCLQECTQLEYIVQKIPHQEVEDMLLEFERRDEQSTNGAVTHEMLEDVG